MMDVIDAIDPYSRPARRTQWIVSTLAYHYGLDRGVENEIIVLATGLDQYLQEIFHHIDYQGGGKIPVEDFNILCEILGLNKDSEDTECAGGHENAPSELSFRHFHAKLCGHFSTKAGCQYEKGRLLVGKDSEHIETQIRLRSPLRRREKLLSVGVSEGSCSSSEGRGHASGCRLGSCTKECYEEIVALEEAEDRIAKLEDENASLRELIEDMRAALQSSDARCLALQVGLWKSHSKHKPEDGCFVAQQKQSVQKGVSTNTNLKSSSYSNLKSLQNLIQEIELLQNTRDQQVEEAMLCNQRLEKELWSSKETVVALEECNQVLKREQVGMRRKVEEARQALLNGLGKVKELEAKASHVPALQRHIVQLESELLYYRSEVSKLQLPSSTRTELPLSVSSRPGQRCCSDSQHDRCSPTGRAVTTPDKMEEQLFRSVEGQAASDEEEDKWTGDQQRQVAEVKRILTRLSCCGERCDDKAFKKLLSNFGSWRSEESCSAVVELLERVTRLHKQLELKESQAEIDMDQIKDSLLQELQQKAEETELLQMELQMLETERVRLSLVEEKLVDILQLLQQLRDLNVSRRSLGKILLSTLESCSDPQHGKAHILEVLNALYHELAACEILSTGGPLDRAQSQQSPNALIISC
ncbi:EF-hand and coiled-coil domain-containing protein 1 [Notolabrus celidotus]|uniref:EF-hand and coiled-coil domain-containing protein 1 n=1 Tax=Notolabrus celidotus TaxID=1203425 RepID=UPI00148F9A8F|nr:EF-hand and coiled-coil domain-containing protein 1 [Notolabrus celidotus]XP_034549130.1 EF-hand and coiled-coil domain-containing protein 1 [Notolabrus celidotus]